MNLIEIPSGRPSRYWRRLGCNSLVIIIGEDDNLRLLDLNMEPNAQFIMLTRSVDFESSRITFRVTGHQFSESDFTESDIFADMQNEFPSAVIRPRYSQLVEIANQLDVVSFKLKYA